jgi:hypothetical protein
LLITYMGEDLLSLTGIFVGPAHRSRAGGANALRVGGRRLSVRAVNGAAYAFIGAKRRPLTEEANGSGAGFSHEGQANEISEQISYRFPA